MRKRSRTVKLTLMGSALFLAGCQEEPPPAPLPVVEDSPGGNWTGSEELANISPEPVDPNAPAPATSVASNSSHSTTSYRSRSSFFPFFFWGGSGGGRSYSSPPPASSGFRTVQTPSTGSKPSSSTFSGSTSHASSGGASTSSASRGGFGSTGRASSSAAS